MARLIGEAYISLLPDSSMFRTDATAQLKRALAGVKGSVPITADVSDAEKKIASLAAALKALGKNVEIDSSTRGVLTDIAEVQTALAALIERARNIPMDFNDSKGLAKLYGMLAGAEELSKRLEDLGDADININRVIAKFYSIEAGVKAIEQAASNMKADFNATEANAVLAQLGAGVGKISEELATMRAGIEDSSALAKLVALQARALKLAKQLENMPVTADTLPFQAQMFKLAAEVEAFKKSLETPMAAFGGSVYRPTGAPTVTTQNDNQLHAMGADLEAVAAKAYAAQAGTLAFLNATKDTGPVVTAAAGALEFFGRQQSMIIASNAGGWWGNLNTKIRLFGGLLDGVLPDFAKAISLWHLGADVIFEFAAAWVPALIAVGTFAAYAYPVGEKIYGQWKNVNTILDGVGGKLPDLGTSFDQVERAIEPSILEAFGEYMMVIGKNAAPLGAALTKVGKVVDDWGASLVGWAGRAQKSFDSIVSVGAKDLAMIGYGFEQVFRILGTLFKDTPGYVRILLAVGDAFLTITADVVQFLSPLIKAGLYVHGFIVYVGLAVTALIALGRAVSAGAITAFLTRTGYDLAESGTAAETASGKFSKFGTAIGALAGNIAGAGANAFRYGKSLFQIGDDAEHTGVGARIGAAGSKLLGDTLGIIPFGAVGAAVGALAIAVGVGLFFAFHRSVDAATQFNKQIQNMIASSNAANIMSNLQLGLAESSQKLAAANVQVAQGEANLVVLRDHARKGLEGYGKAQIEENSGQAKYLQGLQSVASETGTYVSRMNELTKVFGSTGAAQEALNLSGIKAGDIATENNSKWSTTLIELQALAKGYGYMGQQAGAAGNQLDALNIASGTTTKNIQTLTQAESAWVTMVSSGDSAFTAFEQGQQTLAGALKSGDKSGATLTVTVGKLREQYSLAGAAMNGTSQAALAARQAFDAQLSAGVTLYGNLQTLAAASGNTKAAQYELARAGKDIIAQLLPMAAGSKQATAELYGLAQVAGYTGRDNFQDLAKWVGKTQGAEADLNSQQSRLTISMANISVAAKNLGNALNTSLVSAEANVIAKTFGLDSAIQNLAVNALKTHSAVNAAAISFSGEYVSALVRSGDSTSDAKQKLNAYLASLGYSKSAIATIDAQLHDSVGQWNKYTNAVNQNAHSAQVNAKATQANYAAFEQLYGALPVNVAQFNRMWQAIKQEDGALVTNSYNVQAAKAQFQNFAENGLHLTAAQADALWQKFGQNNLNALAANAATTKQHFIDFAENGLHLTQAQAQALWGEFAMQNLDMLVTKGDNAKNKFIDLARNGLDLTASQANNLWNTLKQQYLDTLATKAGETRQAFEKTAGQLGDTKTQADNLWSSLHRLSAGSPYNAAESTTFSGSGSVTAKANIPGQPDLTSHLNFVPGHASGGIVPGASPHGGDNHLAMVKSGELIVPSSHAPIFRDMARKAGIPGFDQGGLVPGEIGSIINAIPFGVNNTTQFYKESAQAFVSSLTSAIKNQLLAGGGPGGPFTGSVPGGYGNGLVIARYLMSQGLNAAAAAGVTATIYGESAWNPESVGSGGWGLIGWTGNTIGLPAGVTGPTGNVERDMANQLRGVIGYMNARGGAGPLNAAGNPVLAGDVWSRYEAPLVPLSDTRPSIAESLYAQLVGSSPSTTKQVTGANNVTTHTRKPFSAGGMVTEPVYGFGAYSGIPYSFAENGIPEQIVPGGVAAQGQGGGMQPATTYQAQTTNQLLAMVVKLLQQMPQATGQAISNGAGNGVRHGYFGAQN